MLMILGFCLLMSSCGSYEASGAYTGATFGNMIGSAIGGIAGGWRGHEIGALIGTVGGAAAGAAIGAAQDRKMEKQMMEREHDYPRYVRPQSLMVRNVAIHEQMRDGMLTRGEEYKVVFEITNNSSEPAYDVYPLVEETSRNRHVFISPNIRIECIPAHQSVRYTATLKADNRLRNGQIQLCVGVAHNNHRLNSQTQCYTINTGKLPGRRHLGY